MFLRRLTIIMIGILFLAALFQVLRSFGMFNFIKNLNAELVLEPAENLNLNGSSNKIDFDDCCFEDYLIVINKGEENSIKLLNQLEKALKYTRKDYEVLNYDEFNALIVENGDTDKDTSDGQNQQATYGELNDEESNNNTVDDEKINDLQKYDCIFFTFERMDNLENPDKVFDFVYQGGRLAILTRPVTDKTFEKYSNYLGIKNFNNNLYTTSGIKVMSDILLGCGDFETDSEIIENSSLKADIYSRCKVHLKSYDNNPLLWESEYGEGKIVFFNGTVLNAKLNRGLIVAILSICKNDFIYPVANIKMLHIDDFPSPVPAGTDAKIYEEYSRNIAQFYQEVWWSDMIKYSKKYDLKYTGYIIETYNDKTVRPFDKGTSTAMRNLMLYGRELLNLGGEIGLHGYNHQSLAPEGFIKQRLGYNSWSSSEDMTASVQELIRFIHSVFGLYELRAYVPPSNILSPEGREAVKSANPNLKVISSVYLPNTEGDLYAQEFEIADDGIIEFPRLTAGYEKADISLWSIYNGINAYGIFAHFIHPDDVLDSERNNNKSWPELSEEFEEILAEISSKYDWLRSFTISPASMELVKYLECQPYVEYRDSENLINIYTDNFREDIYCIMRTDRSILKSAGCGYSKIADDAYLIEIRDNICTLEVN